MAVRVVFTRISFIVLRLYVYARQKVHDAPGLTDELCKGAPLRPMNGIQTILQPAWKFARRLRFFSPRQSSAMRELAQKLGGLGKQPAEAAHQIGARFLNSHALLEQMAGSSETLVTESEELLQLATGKTDGRISVEETAALLKAPLEFLDRWRSGMEAHLKELESASQVLSQLRKSETTLQQTVEPLRFTQTLFRIESARLPEASRQAFASLTQEIDSVQTLVRDTFTDRFRLVASTQDRINGVVENVRSQCRHVEEALESTKVQIDESVHQLLDEIDRNEGRDISLRGTSQAIADEVGRIVVALQTHDIVSQRLSHVSSSLGEAGETLEGYAQSPDADGDRKGPGLVYGSLQVQAAQIEEVKRMLDRTEAALQDSGGKVVAQIETVDRECLLLEEFKEVSAAANGTIQVLLEMIADVRSLAQIAIEVAGDSCRQLEPIGAMAGTLTGSVEQLSHRMRLIALNALVQAIHIGQGTGLEVLAAHTSEVSATTSNFAEGLGSDLRRLSENLGAMLTSFSHLVEEGQGQMAVLNESGADQERKLHLRRDRILEKLTEVGQTNDRIRDCAKAFTAESDARAEASLALAELAESLKEISGEILKFAPTGEVGLDDALKTDGYTMAGQHQVHTTVMDRLSGKSEMIPAQESDERPHENAVEFF